MMSDLIRCEYCGGNTERREHCGNCGAPIITSTAHDDVSTLYQMYGNIVTGWIDTSRWETIRPPKNPRLIGRDFR